MCKTEETHTNLAAGISDADIMSDVLERLDRIEQMLAAKQETWGTVTYIKNHFHISYQQARKLCSTPGVRCHKAPHSWTKYSVDDCSRIFAGEALTSTNRLTRLPLQKGCGSPKWSRVG